MALIYDNTISTAVTQVDIDLTSTPIVKGELYELVFTANTLTAQSLYQLAFNDLTTPTNNYSQSLSATSTTVSGNRANDNVISVANSSGGGFSKTYIKVANDGTVIFYTNAHLFYADTTPQLVNFAGTTTFTVSSITKISIIATVANALGIDSRIQLYKVAEKVDEVIVSGSPVTQVDFTTDIQKGNEYLLVSDIVNGTASGTSLNLYVNDLTTEADYEAQVLLVDNTTLTPFRDNKPYFHSLNASNKSIGVASIKLANSGHPNYQHNLIRDYGTSGVDLLKSYGAYENTVASITKLSLVASVASAIGATSRFELYRLI